MEVQGKGEADWGSQVAEGLLGGRVVELWEACLAPAQQRMEEEDAVPEDRRSMRVNNDIRKKEKKRAHQSALTALLGE